MQPDRSLGDKQAEACPFDRLSAPFPSIKYMENFLCSLGRSPPLIGNDKMSKLAVTVEPDTDFQFYRGVENRVFEQVAKNGLYRLLFDLDVKFRLDSEMHRSGFGEGVLLWAEIVADDS